MNIDEAIRHCEEVAEEKKMDAEMWRDVYHPSEYEPDNYLVKLCRECAEEHSQLARWLRELKAYRELYGEVHWSNKVDDRSGIPANCRYCSNHPINGGSGICHCILGSQTIC